MKAKVVRGRGFRGVLTYILGKEKQAERIGGTMVGVTPRELSTEFAAARKLRPDVERPVWHCSLSLASGERLTPEKWGAVVEDFMERMGFSADTPWVAVRHQDTANDHVHVVASRIGLNGNVWAGHWEARQAIEATQELERKHGLTITPGLGDGRAEQKSLTSNELNMALRTGQEPARQRLQRLVAEASEGSPTATEFVQLLQDSGVKVRANLASTGRLNGFSFELEGVAFKGSDLGRAYRWQELSKRVRYDPDRDAEALKTTKEIEHGQARTGAEHGSDRPAAYDLTESPGAQRDDEGLAGRSSEGRGWAIGADGQAPAAGFGSSAGLRGGEQEAHELVAEGLGGLGDPDPGSGQGSRGSALPVAGGSEIDPGRPPRGDVGRGWASRIRSAITSQPSQQGPAGAGGLQGDVGKGLPEGTRADAADHQPAEPELNQEERKKALEELVEGKKPVQASERGPEPQRPSEASEKKRGRSRGGGIEL